MAIHSTLAKRYWMRKMLLLILFVGFGAYAAYDGFIAYPAQMERFAQHQRLTELQDRRASSSLTTAEADELASLESRVKVAAPTPRTQNDVYVQYAYLVICILGAVAIAATWRLASHRRYVYGDDGSLETPEGVFSAGQMTGLDLRRWQSKSIAMLEIEGGPKSRGGKAVKLDAWIYDGLEGVIDALDRRFHPEEYTGEADQSATQEPVRVEKVRGLLEENTASTGSASAASDGEKQNPV